MGKGCMAEKGAFLTAFPDRILLFAPTGIESGAFFVI
jgi:hypothetical protein